MSHTQNYIDSLQREYHTNVAREHAYRTPFSNYFKALHPHLHASNDPKRIKDIGAPDYIIFKEKKSEQIPFGYIETKDITFSLDKVEKSEQMERYLKLDNVILTNYLEFRFYVYGENVATITIAELDNTIKGIPQNYAKLELWLQQFADFEGKTITSVEDLAQEMATKAQLMRDNFAAIIKQTQGTTLHRQYDKFREVLLHELQANYFVDMYAQTIAYGLFSSGLNHFNSNSGAGFTLINAVQSIPATNPFLQELFSNIGSKEVEKDINYPINALCTIFEYTAFDAILTQIGRNNNGRDDAIIHFYETFLDKYSPETRKSRGVWYTPQPIVNFIVRAIDEVLQTHFGLKAGIADSSKVDIINQQGKTEHVHKVQMLDVATGTGTFTLKCSIIWVCGTPMLKITSSPASMVLKS